jgi:hypothetical protein
MSAGGSYTDFHIDFGGTSVWYHIVYGNKLFLFAPPTEENLKAYTEWTTSAHQSDEFLGDKIKGLHIAYLSAGETMLIPSGWIHAVYTPVDSLVFGGNFLHSFSIDMNLKILDIEIRTNVIRKYRFPDMEHMNWFAAMNYWKKMKHEVELSTFEVRGLQSLVKHLNEWNQSEDSQIHAPSVLKEELEKDFKMDVNGFLASLADMVETQVKNLAGKMESSENDWRVIVEENQKEGKNVVLGDILKDILTKRNEEPLPPVIEKPKEEQIHVEKPVLKIPKVAIKNDIAAPIGEKVEEDEEEEDDYDGEPSDDSDSSFGEDSDVEAKSKSSPSSTKVTLKLFQNKSQSPVIKASSSTVSASGSASPPKKKSKAGRKPNPVAANAQKKGSARDRIAKKIGFSTKG